jgi:hypothetical protein
MNNISLLGKWMPSINTSSKKTISLAKRFIKEFGMSEREYRKMLSALREHIKITERYMSAKDWDEIAYSQVPSRAMKNYRKAFSRNDGTRFGEYIENVKKGDEKIHSGTLYPYDILVAADLTYNRFRGNDHFTINDDPVLEEQWKALPNYIKKAINILVMSDTSGSMQGLPMCVSIGLAIYFAERNMGAYKDLFLTFSEHPEFVQLKGKTLKEKVECVESIVANTDLEAAMDLILKVALDNHVSQEEMPEALVIISDLQFDAATNDSEYGYWNKPTKKQTFHKSMENKFEQAGYKIPKIVYWQVSQRQIAIQVREDDENVMLVSGASTSTFKSIIDNIGKTPWESMLQILSDPQYDVVQI